MGSPNHQQALQPNIDIVSVSDPDSIFTDPDPGFFFNPDPDPGNKKQIFSKQKQNLGNIFGFQPKK